MGFVLVFFSRRFNEVIGGIPLHWLIGLQFYRIIGIAFILLWLAGSLPPAFAHSAGWGDIFVGVTALIVSFYVYKNRVHALTYATAWNVIGILDIVAAIALGASLPIMSQFPMALVPSFLVPMSITLHLFALKRQTELIRKATID